MNGKLTGKKCFMKPKISVTGNNKTVGSPVLLGLLQIHADCATLQA
jgi:hypothetical protein